MEDVIKFSCVPTEFVPRVPKKSEMQQLHDLAMYLQLLKVALSFTFHWGERDPTPIAIVKLPLASCADSK